MATAELEIGPIEANFSLKDRIYASLRGAITSMNIYAEDAPLRLDERELSERLAISRTPIREALARLEQEGLVRIVPRKGVFIVRKTKKEILEMITVWAALESMAARLVTERASDAEIASLRRLFSTFEDDQVNAQIDEYSQRNIDFHSRILKLSKCELLNEMAANLFIHMRSIRDRTIAENNRAKRSIINHMHIIEAIERRETDLAERLVREHTLDLAAHVAANVDYLDRLEDPGGAMRARPGRTDSGEAAMSETATDTLAKKDKSGNLISGGHLVARALKAEGVDTIFTLCGGHIIDIYDGCLDEDIRIIDVRHEQTAAHAADGYARQTGKLGCVVTTAGPGCTNAVTGVATALRSESPVLHIGGQGAMTQHKMGSLQDLPHVDMMAAITKFSASVRSTERVADMVSMAAREAYAGAPGPAYLEIPRDVLDREVPLESARIPEPGHYRASTRSIGDPDDIEKLADLLVEAERPCILLGTQVWTVRGHEAAIELVRGLEIPAYFNGAGRGLLPPGDPHHFNRTRRYAFDKADVIVIVGTPFDFRMGYGRRLGPNAKVVQIDLDYKTVGKNRDIALGLAGDPGAILAAVHQAASGRTDNGAKKRKAWLEELREAEAKATDKLMPMFLSDQSPIHPYRVAWEINEFLTDDTIYIGDGGDVVTISAQAVQPRKPGHWMDPGALGSLGVGTGFAMAAKLAHPNKEVLCYYGDGSFGMTAFDMETANRFGAPYIAVIGNNSAMNQIRYGQLAKYGAQRGSVGNKLGDVPFGKFGEMLGGYGEEVRDPNEIGPALRRARESVLRDGRSAVVNIWVDPNEYAPGTKAQTMYK